MKIGIWDPIKRIHSDGSTRVIRHLTIEDAAALFAFRRYALNECPDCFLATLQEDYSLEAWHDRLSKYPNTVIDGAFHTRRLIGMVGLSRSTRLREAHKASIWGMYVHPDARRQGVGRELMQRSVGYASTHEAIETVHISVVESARAARALYAAVGFQTWGIEPSAVRTDHGLESLHHMLVGKAFLRSFPRRTALDNE